MPGLIWFFLLLNFSLSSYLVFLFYKKNQAGKNRQTSTSTSVDYSQCLQKFSLNRFNPFNQVGGDQSFILILLDNNNSGVIITSLHNRDNTRIYAKQIKNGQGFQSTLSREEKSALAQIIKS